MIEEFEKYNWEMGGDWIAVFVIIVVFIWITIGVIKRYSNSEPKTAEDIFKERDAFVK